MVELGPPPPTPPLIFPSGASYSPGDGESRPQTLIHDDATPLTVLLSVLALSVRERVPMSMGEETVQSVRVCRESMATEAAESCPGGTTSVGGSGVAGCTICVTGRIVGLCAAAPSVSMTTGLKASRMDFWPDSVQGRGGEEGEILGLGGDGEREGLLLMQGGLESNFGVMGESVTGSEGDVFVGLLIDWSTPDWAGGQESAPKEAGGSSEPSVTGTGGEVSGGGLSCIDTAPASAASSGEAWGDSGGMLRGSTGSGDSNTELGLGSMMGVVEINRDVGMGAGEESAFAAADSLSFTWGTAECVADFPESPSGAGGSSAKRGSVMSGASCEEGEDRGRTLLACITPSSLRPVMGLLDREEAE